MLDAVDLTRLSSLPNLERAFTRLGIGPAWHELDATAFPASGGPRRMAMHVPARALPWVLLIARDAKVAARAVARARASLGSPAGVACLEPGNRRLVITVALPEAPLLELSLDSPDPVALAVLARLPGLLQAGALEGATLLAEWLATEPVSTRFFRQFRSTYEAMQLALPAGPGPDDQATLVLLQLTRVLFLYFVQSKGWLDGRADFLAAHVDDTLRRRRDVHRHLLHPLWFGTLNRPAAARGATARRFGRIPFLNGGLFEPHPLERRWHAAFPAETWRSAFDDLFEQFHFVTREGDTAAIGPDTLGRVFEGLMAPDLRHRSGSYYTPAVLVRRMLEAGLGALVASRTGATLGKPADRAGGSDLRRCAPLLRDLTLLDPAAGSGAFLLGALDLLTELTQAEGESRAAARRRIVSRNLYGVDLNPAAVRLAELRLWLAVIADETSGDAMQVAPLPNLDAIVRQGDSLWDRYGARMNPHGRRAGEVSRARHQLLMSTGPSKRQALKALRLAEESAAFGSLTDALAATEATIREWLEQGRSRTLFGERRGLSRQEQAALTASRQERRRLRHSLRQLADGGQLTHFDYAIQFADIMAAGGFDVVVGNPPWVRGEAIPPPVRKGLAHRYRWYRGSGQQGYRNGADLAVAFIERGLELTSPGGVLAFLIPSKIRQAGYAAAVRHGLAHGTTIDTVADVEPADARAFGATVYPMALIASKSAPPPGHTVATSLADRSCLIVQESLRTSGPWILTGDGPRKAATRLAAEHPPLGSNWKVQLGVKTGADDLFLTREPDIEPSLLRRAIRGRDLRPDGPHPTLWLRWPCDARGGPLASLPPRAEAWFRRNADRLRRRADYRDGPAWRLFRTGAAIAPHRVIWPDLSRRLQAVSLDPATQRGSIPLNTCYVIAPPNADLAARIVRVLNSTWVRALAQQAAPVASGGYRRYSARVVESLPMPRAALAEPLRAATPADIDLEVADWLGLSSDERDTLADLSQARS